MTVTAGQANNLSKEYWTLTPNTSSPKSTSPHAAPRLCTGEHSFYMASEVEIPERGKLALLGFCTHCAAPLHLEFDILRK